MDINLKENLLFLVISIICLVYSHSASASSNAIAAGLYCNTSNGIRPLLANSFDGGATWSYPLSILSSLPANVGSSAIFNGASCSGYNCNAGGYYQTIGSITYPLLASSQDGGHTWKYPSTIVSSLPVDFENGKFNSFGRCSGIHCLAAGEYINNLNIQFPLLAMSHNAGKTWNYPVTVLTNLPSDYSDNGKFVNATSRASHFFGVGQYKDTSNRIIAWIAASHDNGVTWSYPITVRINLPTDYSNGIFKSIVCSVPVCVAVGQYDSTWPPYIVSPLIATSHDNGVTWGYLTVGSAQLPSDFDSLVSLNSVGCNANNCVAAGEYKSNTPGSDTYPYLISSQDGGQNWTFPSTILTQLPSDYTHTALFHGAHCNRNICIATGEYVVQMNNRTHPLLASSSDGGVTWIYPSSIKDQLPANFLEGKLYGVHCNRKDCVAEGQYKTTTPNSVLYPIVATSHDGGITWTYPQSVVTNLPVNYSDNGTFSGGYSSFTLKNINSVR